MCGRFSRAKDAHTYTAPLFPNESLDAGAFFRSWNIAPGTVQPVMYEHSLGRARWGVRPALGGAKQPLLFNCRLDDRNAATWKTMWRTARVVVPADGWYEFVVKRGTKQPYFIRPLDDRPLYLAGLSSVAPEVEPQQGDGFVLVTSGTERGIVDVHARLPLTLSAADARRWLDARTTFARAQSMVRESVRPRQLFRSFQVSVGVNVISNDEPAFNDPLSDVVSA
jgi:putative SOS response-associated peptidase YedK